MAHGRPAESAAIRVSRSRSVHGRCRGELRRRPGSVSVPSCALPTARAADAADGSQWISPPAAADRLNCFGGCGNEVAREEERLLPGRLGPGDKLSLREGKRALARESKYKGDSAK
jgi:hypothetical protein